jgi:hypothetical protein
LIYYDYLEKLGSTEMSRQRALVESAAYQQGDPDAVAARYRIHFKPALKRAEHYETLIATMNSGFLAQGKQGILKARAVEDRPDARDLGAQWLRPDAETCEPQDADPGDVG